VRVSLVVAVALLAGCANSPPVADPIAIEGTPRSSLPLVTGIDLWSTKVQASSNGEKPTLAFLLDLPADAWRSPGDNGAQSTVEPVYDCLLEFQVQEFDGPAFIEAFSVMDGQVQLQWMSPLSGPGRGTMVLEARETELDQDLLIVAGSLAIGLNLTLWVRDGTAASVGTGEGAREEPMLEHAVRDVWLGPRSMIAFYDDRAGELVNHGVEVNDTRTEVTAGGYLGGDLLLRTEARPSHAGLVSARFGTGAFVQHGTWDVRLTASGSNLRDDGQATLVLNGGCNVHWGASGSVASARLEGRIQNLAFEGGQIVLALVLVDVNVEDFGLAAPFAGATRDVIPGPQNTACDS
jgi:hypothetical protein